MKSQVQWDSDFFFISIFFLIFFALFQSDFFFFVFSFFSLFFFPLDAKLDVDTYLTLPSFHWCFGGVRKRRAGCSPWALISLFDKSFLQAGEIAQNMRALCVLQCSSIMNMQQPRLLLLFFCWNGIMDWLVLPANNVDWCVVGNLAHSNPPRETNDGRLAGGLICKKWGMREAQQKLMIWSDSKQGLTTWSVRLYSWNVVGIFLSLFLRFRGMLTNCQTAVSGPGCNETQARICTDRERVNSESVQTNEDWRRYLQKGVEATQEEIRSEEILSWFSKGKVGRGWWPALQRWYIDSICSVYIQCRYRYVTVWAADAGSAVSYPEQSGLPFEWLDREDLSVAGKPSPALCM